MALEKNGPNTWMEKLLDTHKELFNLTYRSNYGAPAAWREIVEEAVNEIAKNADSSLLKKDIRIVQIKEKFGYLRIYVDFSDPIIDQIIQAAESKAARICADCGSTKNEDESCPVCGHRRPNFQRWMPPNA